MYFLILQLVMDKWIINFLPTTNLIFMRSLQTYSQKEK